jgi:23S rRNA (uridine2552-2'-O)-methyltransferase
MARKNPYRGPDRFTTAAKSAGYPARSVFKLEEIDRRVRLLRPGQKVLDLGAAPGSWTLYAAQRVGRGGHVLAADLKMLEIELPENVTFVQGDALIEEGTHGDLPGAISAHAPYDVVLSDMAPNTSGNRFADQARSFELFMRALAVAKGSLRMGGSFVGKIFMGEDLPEARKALRRSFAEEKLIRPEGTRSVSYEIFVVGLGRKEADPSP